MFGSRKPTPETAKEVARPRIVVSNVRAGSRGVYMDMRFPVSFSAYQLIQEELLAKSVKIPCGGGGGDSDHCQFAFGPFATLDEAKTMIKEFQEAIAIAYNTDQQAKAVFGRLEGEYPIN